VRARTSYISYQSGVDLAPSYLPDTSEHPDEIAVMVGPEGVNDGQASSSSSRRGTTASLNSAKPDNNSPRPVPDIGNSYDNVGVDTGGHAQDLNVDFPRPWQFMARNAAPVAEFNHSPPSRSLTSLDQLYSREPQHMAPALNFSVPDQLCQQPRFFPLQDPPQSPNQVWVDFMQQLTTEGYHALP
jgi:hypothetical protein